MAQLGFYFDMRRCTGCQCCTVACKDVKDLEIGNFYRKAVDYEGGTFPAMWAATLSMACNHCDTPACITVCPVGAITKSEENGLVYIDEELCIGCEACVAGCPYAAPIFDANTKVAKKCDGCLNFLAVNEQPACVAACSTRCLRFGDVAELESSYSSLGVVKDLTVLPDSTMTGPNFLITPKPEMAK